MMHHLFAGTNGEVEVSLAKEDDAFVLDGHLSLIHI